MKPTTIAVYANPYHGLDHVGRLAGACPEGELPRPAGAAPHRRCVGAVRRVTEGSYVADSSDPGLRIAVGDRAGNLAIAPFVMSTADVYWQFDADPHDYHVGDRRLEHFYAERVKHGEIFAEEGGAPMRKLAEARMAAIKSWRDHYGDEPLPFDMWAKQYPLDEKVAAEQAKLEAPAPKPAKPAPISAVSSDTTKGS